MYAVSQITSPILDQGSLGTCAENAVVTALDVMMRQAGHPIAALSRMQLYADVRTLQGDFEHDTGTIPSIMLNALKNTGIAYEASWAYNPALLYQVPPLSVVAEAAQNKINSWSSLNIERPVAGITADVGKLLAQGKTVLLSFNVRDYFYDEDGPLGEIVGHGAAGNNGEGHMVAIRDMDATGFIVQNSWDTGWGDGGYGRVDYVQFSSYHYDLKGLYTVNGFMGLDFTWSAARVTVAQAYATVLGRAAETSGLNWWAGANLSRETLITSLLNSGEGAAHYGSMSTAQFLDEMYDNVLGRDPDASGLAFYSDLIDNQGWTRAKVFDLVVGAVAAPNGEAAARAHLENVTNLSGYVSIAMQYAGGHDAQVAAAIENVTSDANQLEIIKVGLPDALFA